VEKNDCEHQGYKKSANSNSEYVNETALKRCTATDRRWNRKEVLRGSPLDEEIRPQSCSVILLGAGI